MKASLRFLLPSSSLFQRTLSKTDDAFAPRRVSRLVRTIFRSRYTFIYSGRRDISSIDLRLQYRGTVRATVTG